MAIIRPFKAVRPAADKAHLVASVPYDVVNREEAAAYCNDNPYSLLRVTRSEIELASDLNPYDSSVYQKAKENFQKLIDQKILVKEDIPYIYVYRLEMGKQVQVGLAATFSVDDYDNNIILKHEKTRKVKEDDRTNHIITTGAQTGPVFLTYKGRNKVNEIVAKVMSDIKPLYDFASNDNIKHTIWIMPKEYNDTIISEIENVEKLYIADGHHRAASASRTRATMKAKNAKHNGNEEYNYFIAVLFPAEQLKILPYNRLVFDLNGLNENEFIEKVKINFTVEKTDLPAPIIRKTFCMYINNQWYLLTPNDNIKPTENVGYNLDVSILQNYLLNPVLGIEDPRTSNRIDFIGGIRGTEELENFVNGGKAATAFSLYPLAVDDLINISDAGEIMPPKSTWFEPKLRDGLLVHLIEE